MMTTILKEPIVYAPVYIPNTPDCEFGDGEKILTEKKIKYLSKTFNKYKIIDLQHEFSKRILKGKKPIQRGELVASYIAKNQIKLKGMDGNLRTYPKGTWIVGIKITDKTAMMLYNQGKLTGVSATAKKKNDADFLKEYISSKSVKNIPKRILLSDIKDPVVFTISLVEKPCVFGAKYSSKSCILKNSKKLEDNSMSIMDVIKEKINNSIDDIDLEDLENESQKEDKNTEEVVDETQEEKVDETVEDKDNQEETEEKDEEETEEEVETGDESQKEYVTRDEVSSLFKAGFEEVKEDIAGLVDSNINESITALQESQKEALGYVTADEVKDIFTEEFGDFKNNLKAELKARQEESIKQFSKTIDSQTSVPPADVEDKPRKNKLFEGRDANGCRVR